MKLLFDENFSFRLVARLAAAFPGNVHVDSVGLHSPADSVIWDFARDNGFAIVSKDDDFRQLSFLYGAPPKVIWLSVGNASTDTILRILNDQLPAIEAFESDPVESFLIFELSEPAP